MKQPVTVAASTFEDLVAIGLRQIISEDPNIELVADDIALEDLESVLNSLQPSVVLLNYGSLPSPAFVYQLHQGAPDTRIVVLANRPTAAECNQLLSFGATACVSKETQGRDIINALHLASRGMHVMPRSAATTPSGSSGFSDRMDMPEPDLLTAREADVLELLQTGASNAEIAHELSIGIETVRTHARNIYRKLGISTRRDLARLTRAESSGRVARV
jgi:NarL family two-component system response regulator LiaR